MPASHDLKHALNGQQKDYAWKEHAVEITNVLRQLENEIVDKATTHRLTLTVDCLHTRLNDALIALGIPFVEADITAKSPGGENGSGDKRP